MKKSMFAVPCAALLMAALTACNSAVGAMSASVVRVNAVPAAAMTLSDTVSETGTVESSHSVAVSAPVASPSNPVGKVKSVDVKLGDPVKAGDILCQIDTEALEMSIKQQEAALALSQAVSAKKTEMAKNDLDNAQNNLDNGLDSTTNNAYNAVENARIAMQKAHDIYNGARSDLITDGNDRSDLSASDRAKLDSYARDYASARNTYKNALQTLETVKNSTSQGLDKAEDNVELNELGQNSSASEIAIDILRKQLVDSTIVAPIDGTITSLAATEGASASGQLFQVEDTARLKIAVLLSEFDVADLAVGAKVTVQSDSSGGKLFEGTLSALSPAASKNAGGGVKFPAEISIENGEGLLIGSTARLTIYKQEKPDVIAVAHDAVVTDKEGKAVVFVAQPDSANGYLAHAVPVTTGMKTGTYTEIIEGLSAGDLVISSPGSLKDGEPVAVNNKAK